MPLFNHRGEPLDGNSPIVGIDGEELSAADPPVEDALLVDENSEESRLRALQQSLQSEERTISPAAIASELIQKQKFGNLSASERRTLRMSLIANEMAQQNLVLWVALHGICSATNVKTFTVGTEKLKKWGELPPTKWPISAARLASGSVAFEILPEPFSSGSETDPSREEVFGSPNEETFGSPSEETSIEEI
jgi:hypothetical protein